MSSRLPKGWTSIRLGNLGAWKGGGTPSKARADYWENGTIPWVSPKDMKVAVVRDAEDRITEGAIAGSSTSVIEAGAVLVVVRSGILRHTLPVAVTAVDVALNQDMKALAPSGAASPEYVVWALGRFEPQILHRCTRTGTTVQNIAFPMFSDFEIPLPPLAAQRRIVAAIEEHLSRLDAAVAGLERVQAVLPRYRAAVLKAAVEGRLDAESSAVGRRGKRAGGSNEVTMGEIGLEGPRSLIIGPFGSNLKVSDYRNSGVPLVFVRNIRAASFGGEGTRYVSKSKAHELAGHQVLPGDVLVTKMGDPPGDACVYPSEAAPAIVTADCIRIRPNLDLVSAQYLVNAIRSEPVRRQILDATRGVAQLKVSLERFRSIRITLPPLKLQEMIVEELERSESVIEAAGGAVDVALMRAGSLRQSILARAFRGELVPQDPNDEPAEVLLERIRAERAGVVPVRRAPRRKKVAGKK